MNQEPTISDKDNYLPEANNSIRDLQLKVATQEKELEKSMLDFGFHKPLRGLNSGVRVEISTCPACQLAILTA